MIRYLTLLSPLANSLLAWLNSSTYSKASSDEIRNHLKSYDGADQTLKKYKTSISKFIAFAISDEGLRMSSNHRALLNTKRKNNASLFRYF